MARDGVFTPVLTKEITRKDVSLQAVLINVRKEVQRLTDDAQTPGEYSQMTDFVYLAGKSNVEKDVPIQKMQKNDTVAQNKTGTLCITSGVDSDVYLNGKKAGKLVASKPFLQQNMPLGIHQVELRSSIGKSMKTVSIKENEPTNIYFKTEQIKIDDGWDARKRTLIALCPTGVLISIPFWSVGLVTGEHKGIAIVGGIVGVISVASGIIGLIRPNSFHYETRFASALENAPVLKNICFATNGIQTTVGYRFNL